MPVVIGRNCVGENLQRQCGDGLSKAVIPKPISKSSEKKRGPVSPPIRANASKMPVMMPLDAVFNYNMDDCLPPADQRSAKRGLRR